MKDYAQKKQWLALLFILVGFIAKAQKAYETVNYFARSGTKSIKIAFADGYFPATKIIIKDQRGAENFYPVSGLPDEKGRARFEPKSKNLPTRYVIVTLDDLEAKARPARIPLVVVDGKTTNKFIALAKN